MSDKAEDQNRLMKDVAEPPDKIIYENTPTSEVMQIMDSMDLRVLPVLSKNNLYLGFVTKNGIFNKYRHILKRQVSE